jgi:hypothetical protein
MKYPNIPEKANMAMKPATDLRLLYGILGERILMPNKVAIESPMVVAKIITAST